MPRPADRPLVVLVPGPQPPTGSDVPPGRRARPGFGLPTSPWDLSARGWLCLGTIADADDAALAIEALSRGVDLVVSVVVEGDLRLRTLEDLHRLATVTGVSQPEDHGLDDVHRRLLDALAEGSTVTEAARGLHLSRRTANRRLAEVRDRLAVTSNAEAIAHWTARRG